MTGMNIIDLNQARKERSPHSTGKARCLQCGHEWVAVAPVGAVWLECPHCQVERGCFIGPCAPENNTVWQCNCGNLMFFLTPDGPMCPVCGTYHDPD